MIIEKPYEPIWVCPYDGHRVETAVVPMYPTGNPGTAFHCRVHGLLMLWELCSEAAWPARAKFLATKAGKLELIGQGDR